MYLIKCISESQFILLELQDSWNMFKNLTKPLRHQTLDNNGNLHTAFQVTSYKFSTVQQATSQTDKRRQKHNFGGGKYRNRQKLLNHTLFRSYLNL